MKKIVIALSLLTSINAIAYEIDTKACAGTAYIEDLSGQLVEYQSKVHTFVTSTTTVTYKAWRQIPHIVMQVGRSANFYVENKSNHDIKFFMAPRYYTPDGLPVLVSPHTLGATFSISNDPSSSSGADLTAHSIGRIDFPATSATYIGSAGIHWESNECIKNPPIVSSSYNFYGTIERAGMSIYLTNNGNAW